MMGGERREGMGRFIENCETQGIGDGERTIGDGVTSASQSDERLGESRGTGTTNRCRSWSWAKSGSR